ncbi:peptide chain release factor 1 [Pararoseomonas sp. SCSIO 73927]
MTDAEIERAQEELDRLLNDPEVRMDPARVWALAGRLSQGTAAPGAQR